MKRQITIGALSVALVASQAGAQALHQAPGHAQAVAVGPQNQIFAIGPSAFPTGDGHVFRWTGSNWERFSGHGTRIAVDHTGNPWLVNSRKEIWRHLAGRWIHLGGTAIDIAAGGGQIFILGMDEPAPGNGTVHRWSENGWSRVGGWGSRIAVDHQGNPWLVNTSREIWRNAGRWEKLPGSARAIGSGPGGHVYVIGTDNPAPGNGGLYRWDNGRWTGIGGYGTDITANREGRPLVVNSHQQVWGPFSTPPAAAAFGHGSLRVENRPARGARPVVVVLMEYQDQRFRPESTRSYFDGLFYGIGNPTPANALAYFSEISGRTFTLLPGRDRFIGPVVHPMNFTCAHRHEECESRDSDDPEAFLRAFAEVLSVPPLAAVDWRQFDRNSDRKLTNDELLLVFVQALPRRWDGGGINRRFPGDCARTPGPVELCLDITLVGEGTDIATIVHEMGHSLGMVDIYGARTRMNHGFSTMSATVHRGNPRHRTYHLDPWHKIALGWADPHIHAISPMRQALDLTLEVPARTGQPYRPIVFYDPARGSNEFLVVEFRNALPGTYDAHVASNGVVVWSVKLGSDRRPEERPSFIHPGKDRRLQTRPTADDALDGDWIGWGRNQVLETRPARGSDDRIATDRHNFILGAPDQTLGRGAAWTRQHGVVQLRWPDGADTGLRMEVGDFAPGATSVQARFSFQ